MLLLVCNGYVDSGGESEICKESSNYDQGRYINFHTNTQEGK